MASTGDLRSLLGTATFSSIPNNTAVVLQQAWSNHTDTLKAQLEKVKVDAEQKVAELSAANSELTSKLSVYSQETERGQSALQQYREQVGKLFVLNILRSMNWPRYLYTWFEFENPLILLGIVFPLFVQIIVNLYTTFL